MLKYLLLLLLWYVNSERLWTPVSKFSLLLKNAFALTSAISLPLSIRSNTRNIFLWKTFPSRKNNESNWCHLYDKLMPFCAQCSLFVSGFNKWFVWFKKNERESEIPILFCVLHSLFLSLRVCVCTANDRHNTVKMYLYA